MARSTAGWRGAGVVTALGALAAGCGMQVPYASAPPAVTDGIQVDMCAILSDRELAELGITVGTRTPFDEVGVVGCYWLGKPFTLSLDRDNNTLTSYQPRRRDPAFVSFADNTVNGRAGTQLVLDRDRSQCTQLMDGGPISLTVSVAASSSLGPPIDACVEALRIAQMIEPRLPRV
ncbi:MAG: DUF3558 domain-containing protein [Actinomycetota bacterium]|nr:DUF3558 domain-containing protein [Actinomycetota bacterium]